MVGHKAAKLELPLVMKVHPIFNIALLTRPQGRSMLIAMQPSYNELRHAVGMCFTLGSPLCILNVHYTKSIKGSIILEQKDVLCSLIDYCAGPETQRLNVVGS